MFHSIHKRTSEAKHVAFFETIISDSIYLINIELSKLSIFPSVILTLVSFMEKETQMYGIGSFYLSYQIRECRVVLHFIFF